MMTVYSKLLQPPETIRVHKISSLSAVVDYYQIYRRHLLGSVILVLSCSLVIKIKKAFRESRFKSTSTNVENSRRVYRKETTSLNGAVTADRDFIKDLRYLLKIIIPGWRTKEIRLIVVHSGFLVIRTLLSLYVANLDGKLVSSLVRGQGKSFLTSLTWWMAVAIPATFTNSILSFHQCQLALLYRARLTNEVHKSYLSGTNFYSLTALDGQVQNADHIIAVDIANLSNSLAEIYSNLAKPVLDILMYSYTLSRSVGIEGLLGMGLLIQVTAGIIRALMPPFGKFVAREAQLDGELRFHHSRLINYSEEIALLDGHEAEKDKLDKEYFTLIKFVNRVLRRRLYHGMMEDFIIKYLWGALGLILCSSPIFLHMPGSSQKQFGGRAENFVITRRILLMSSDALGRIMVSYKDIMELAGYTARVSRLFRVIGRINSTHDDRRAGLSNELETGANVTIDKGQVVPSRQIKITNVPVAAPNGDILVRSLNVLIRKGEDLLIVGPNGCGKSSLFRILGGLWPIQGGILEKPAYDEIFYVPQRPYLSRGSLRQQIIYPDDTERMHAKGISDDDINSLLRLVGINFVSARYGGLDACEEWSEQLSSGIQQRIAMVRLFYHVPKYAILDECTSSVTLDIEKKIFREAKRLGITLITVSHRRSLWKYHKHILQFSGQGDYKFSRLKADQRAKLEDEKEDLDNCLRTIPFLEKRLSDLSG